jgi:lysophospholipase L1-like esterase
MTEPLIQARSAVSLRARLLAMGLAVVAALGVCEVVARLAYAAPPDRSREPKIAYQSNRETGFLHVPGQRGWSDEGLATINALGLRGSMPAIPKPAGTLRILAIGDSLTFGWGVNDDETYPARLEALLRERFTRRQVEVVNGGVVAYDLRNAARLLRYFAPALEPDVVLVGVFWNDLPYEDVTLDGSRLDTGTVSAFRDRSGRASSDVPISSAVTSVRDTMTGPQAIGPPRPTSKPFHLSSQTPPLRRLLRSSRLLFALRHAWLSAIEPTAAAANQVQWERALLEGRSSAAIDAAWEDVRRTLAEIASIGEAAGFPVALVTMPIRAQVETRYPNARYQTRVREIGRSLGVFVIDPLPRLVAHAGEGLFIPYDRMHLVARGNELMAEAVAEALQQHPPFTAARPDGEDTLP